MLVVSNAKGVSAAAPVRLSALAPGIFFDPVTGFAAPPSHQGDLIDIYCTGLGAAADATQVFLASTPAEVELVGLSSGEIGVYQIKVRIPGDAPAGIQPLYVVTAGVR